MDKFIKMLEERGIKDKLFSVLEKNPETDIASIIEYEISQDENFEDVFLSEAHELAMNSVCSDLMKEYVTKKLLNPDKIQELGEALGKVVESIADAFDSVFNPNKNHEE